MKVSKYLKQRSLGWLPNITMVAAIAATGMGIAGHTATANASEDELRTLEQAFEDAFYENDKNFYRDRSIFRTVQSLFFNYPENEIREDAQAVNRLYRDALRQQTSSDPTIRTPDLYNPFDRSLLSAPDANGSNSPSQNQVIWQAPR
jgi:hypothetical protein